MIEQKPKQNGACHYTNVPYAPEARFALMQINRAPGIRQVHPLPVSQEARQKASEQTLALCAEAMTPNGQDVVA